MKETIMDRLSKKFQKTYDEIIGNFSSTTFESLHEFENMKIAQANGDVEIEGEVKSLKINGKKINLNISDDTKKDSKCEICSYLPPQCKCNNVSFAEFIGLGAVGVMIITLIILGAISD